MRGKTKKKTATKNKKRTGPFVLKQEFSSTIVWLPAFLSSKTSISSVLWIKPTCSKLSEIVCTFPLGLKVTQSIRKIHLHRTIPHGKATELASSQFWTLYKGKCLQIFGTCANPQWIEIYLKLLLCVQKHVQSIYKYICMFFLFQVCVYKNPFI